MTEWRSIPGFPSFVISRSGQVRRVLSRYGNPANKPVNLIMNCGTIPSYRLNIGGRAIYFSVERLLRMTFVDVPDDLNEIWRPIPGLEYEASADGRIRKKLCRKTGSHGKPLAMNMGTSGYLILGVYEATHRKSRYVHRLVCAAFHGNAPTAQHETRHLDGNKLNNSASNLAWGTGVENQMDMRRHGTAPILDRNGRTKITTDDVREIRRIADASIRSNGRVGHGTWKRLANRFGLSKGQIQGIGRRRSWTSLPDETERPRDGD